jgi:ubiquinone/menaquinone biosynthesis C-methylase UbiE
MAKLNDLKSIVKEKYAEIAANSTVSDSDDCGCGCCGESQSDFTIMKDEYKQIDGYVAEADLGLGCGLPTQYANIKEGETIVDLGSGAGNDVFVARSIVGEEGRVIGIDMTEEMIDKAVINNSKLGFENVEFRLGDIENMPVETDSVDVVVSNCVLNLVPDKTKAFKEIYRILKPGGHFCVSDIVTKGELPDEIRRSAELYAGCVSGAVDNDEYLNIIEKSGFGNVEVHKHKEINLPDQLLKEFLADQEFQMVKNSDIGIHSITVSGYKY